MKRILLALLCICIISTSCSKDDDSNDKETISIVGLWSLTAVMENKVDISNSCEKKTTMQIFENKSISYKEYQIHGDICDLDSRGAFSGNYTKINDSTYSLTINGETNTFILEDKNTLTLSGEGDNGFIVKMIFSK